jgi:putative heme transporter
MATTTLEPPVVTTTASAHARSDRGVAVGAPRRRVRRLVTTGVVALVLVVEAVLAAPYLSGAMTSLMQAADAWVGLAVLATAGSLTAFALVRRRLLQAAGLPVSTASSLASVLVGNAFHMTLPGGVAFSTGYAFRWMRRHGAGSTVAGWNLAVNGVLSTASLAGLGLVASLLAGTTSWVRLAIEIAGIAAAVLGVGHLIRHPDRAAELARGLLARVDRLRGRSPGAGGDRLAETVAQLRAVRPTARDWVAAAAYALLNWVLDLVCLAACTHALGIAGLTPTVLLAAYVAGMAASSLSLLPGGLGVVDAALVLGLVAGGAAAAPALSVVVLYRLISLVGVVVAGWVVHAAQLSTAPSPSPVATSPVASSW